MRVLHSTLREADIVALQEIHGGAEMLIAACPEVFAHCHVWALQGPNAATGCVAVLVRRARFPVISDIVVTAVSPGRCLRVQFDCGDEQLAIWSLHNQLMWNAASPSTSRPVPLLIFGVQLFCLVTSTFSRTGRCR